MSTRPTRRRYLAWAAAACLGTAGAASLLQGQAPPNAPANPAQAVPVVQKEGTPPQGQALSPEAAAQIAADEGNPFACLLGPDRAPIDLGSALKLAGVNNPQILLARQRVVLAVAQRQFAAAQLLPSAHLGASYDNHNGTLQQSSGNMLSVNRSSVYFGGGAYAIAAGTVNIPGIFWTGNVADALFGALSARQVVEARGFASRAVENEMLRRVGVTFTDLLRAEGQQAVARRVLEEAREAERLSEAFWKAGKGKESDYERARTERAQRDTELLERDGEILIASARLAELLNMPPTTRLVAVDDKLIPCELVPESKALPELLAVAVMNRPELMERQALIRQALVQLRGAKLLPFSPTMIIGLSYGGEGGGSNLVAAPPGANNFASGEPRFGRFAERMDFDVVGFWSLENLAFGNVSRVRLARSQLGTRQLELLETLDRVRAEVANAYARAHARFAMIAAAEQAVREAMATFEADVRAVRGGAGLPIELLEAVRLLARARTAYVNAIADYNVAEIDLYVALGQPPAAVLAAPVPTGLPPSAIPPRAPNR